MGPEQARASCYRGFTGGKCEGRREMVRKGTVISQAISQVGVIVFSFLFAVNFRGTV